MVIINDFMLLAGTSKVVAFKVVVMSEELVADSCTSISWLVGL